jgi:hypothetical protein
VFFEVVFRARARQAFCSRRKLKEGVGKENGRNKCSGGRLKMQNFAKSIGGGLTWTYGPFLVYVCVWGGY